MDIETLSANIDRDDWLVCDVRHQLANSDAGELAYATSHLPGAIFLHLDRDLSSPLNGRNGRHPLPDPAALAELFGKIGIDETIQVVVYDDAGGMIAGRLWWMLRWLGHDRVALLDGGFPAWKDAGLSVTSEVSHRSPKRFRAVERSDMRISVDRVEANLIQGDLLVVDARSPDRFRGENETLDPIGGHIPGARNRFFRDNLDHLGFLKSPDELRQAYADLAGGLAPNRIVHQCGSGVSACLSVLAMEHAGMAGSLLYAGSWSEWCSDHATPSPRPIARGAS